MVPFKTIVVGDSVAWGQGLPTEQKSCNIAARKIAQATGHDPPETVILARSGAVVAEPQLSDPLPTSIDNWQEVPHSTPTLFQQVDGHASSPDLSTNLVIIVGGLNDVGAFNTIDPLKSEAELEEEIHENCFDDMKRLLRRTRSRFPNAVIVVAGYFPILSEESDLNILRLTVTLLTLGTGIAGGLATAAIAKLATRRARFSHRRQLYWLRRAVTEVQADGETRGPDVIFAHPAFGPQNSVGAPRALLFGPSPPGDLEDWWNRFIHDPLTHTLAIEPDDPMSRERRAACELARRESFELVECRIAAIGHPNQRGARQYAQSIEAAYLGNWQVALRGHLKRLLRRSSSLSLRKAAQRYNLDRPSLSLRGDLLQHLTIDCIEVVILTRDVFLAGTNHDVFLDLGNGREWKLNENVFEGDLFNDFERGEVSSFTIDPSEGSSNDRLHLGDIQKVTLKLKVGVGGELEGGWQPQSLKLALNGRTVLKESIQTTLRVSPLSAESSWTAPDYPVDV